MLCFYLQCIPDSKHGCITKNSCCSTDILCQKTVEDAKGGTCETVSVKGVALKDLHNSWQGSASRRAHAAPLGTSAPVARHMDGVAAAQPCWPAQWECLSAVNCSKGTLPHSTCIKHQPKNPCTLPTCVPLCSASKPTRLAATTSTAAAPAATSARGATQTTPRAAAAG